MYFHFQKIQAKHPCTEMTGFTRLLASSGGQLDELAKIVPTIAVAQAGHDTTRGFQVGTPLSTPLGLSAPPPKLFRCSGDKPLRAIGFV